MGSLWMRRLCPIPLRLNPSSLSSTSLFFPSFLPFKPPPMPNSLHNFPPGRLFLSSAATSSASPLLSKDDNCSSSGACERSGTAPKSSRVLLKEMRYTELERWVQSHGFRPGQAMMLWKRLYGNNIWAHSVDELEGLNKDFKKMLAEHADFTALSLKEIREAADGTRKEVTDFIHTGRWSGRMGLTRNLTAAEIVEQAVFARRLFSDEVGAISNVVFMGMGEPLHNVENVIKASDIMVHDQGLHFSPRKVTVSTSGLVPQLKRFLHESNCALAVSLNATTDEVRNWIMPINRKYKLDMLLQTLREEINLKHKYKVLFEYVMLAGVNDSIDDAQRLIELVRGIPCKINLISFNPHSGSKFRPTPEEKIIEFRNILAEGGCTVLLRPSRGDDEMAACGQLGKPGPVEAPRLRVPQQFQMALNMSQ